MASASAIRSPLPPPSVIPDDLEPPCPFQRSRSKVFYESEMTSGTSWEFRGIHTDSPVLIPVHQMQLSLLRSPIANGRIESPIPLSPDSSLPVDNRNVPSPSKDDLSGNGSDGSRNSTGSSTGSHRSQDSGFSDSGECKPPSRRSVVVGSGGNNGTSSSMQVNCSHLQSSHLSANRSNQCNENCSQIEQHEGNKIYLQSLVHNNNNNSCSNIQHQSHNRSSSLLLQPPPPQDCHHPVEESHPHPSPHPVHQQSQSPSIYSQAHHHYVHERCYSSPVPSPIPHSGSGCGKLILKNTSYKQIQLMKSPYPHHLQDQQQQQHQRLVLHHQSQQQSNQGDYGETNGNGVGDCSNCIYQEIVLSQSPQPNCNSSHTQHQAHYQSQPGGNYALYSTISQQDQNGHLGAPICASTPKRPNVSFSTSSSRLTIMQKIDNFESLNKNKNKLDSNNNSKSNNNASSTSNGSNKSSNTSGSKSISQSNANSSKSNSKGILMSNSQTQQTTKTLSTSTNASPLSHHGHGVSQISATAASLYETSSKKSLSSLSKSKKHPKLSNSSLSPVSNHNHSTSASPSTFMTDFSNNENKTVVQRVPATELSLGTQPQPQPPLPLLQPSSSSSSRLPLSLPPMPSISSLKNDNEGLGEDAENNNNFTLNEFSTYASQRKLKACTKVSPKWESLPRGYKRIPLKGFNTSFMSETSAVVELPSDDVSVSNPSEKLIIVKSHFDNDAMRLWLHELRSQTEPECLHMLQTKSLMGEPTERDSVRSSCSTRPAALQHAKATSSTGDSESMGQGSQHNRRGGAGNNKSKGHVIAAIHGISSPLMSIRNVERMANVVSGEFAKICKNIEFGFLSQVPNLVLSLVLHVEEFLRAFQGSSGFGNLQKLENKLSRSCRRLHRSAQVMIDVTSPETSGSSNNGETNNNNIYSIIEPDNGVEGYHVAVSEVVDGIVTVGNLFSQVVDLRLTRDLSCILDTIEGGGIPSKVALKSFATVLADGGNHLCRLASEIRTVRGLLGVILDARDSYDKILSLRCLATILCVGEAVKDFDRAGGFEIVADFMYESMCPMDIKIEAVSVLTQATDPWIDLETSLCSLGIHLEKIVVALTNLIPECKSTEESFLLVVAAISNLTFLEVSSIGILRRCNTVSLIIDAIDQAQCEFSVFVLDHVATILANMAGVESCRADIVKSGGVHALLNFLQRRPSPSKESASEIMACERVQQKSTIAISRLCTEEGVAKFLLEHGGYHRLVVLSRDEKERNYSDGVLIAALATLRKLVTVCGDEVISGLHAEDLIQPRLLDSFLLYSSRQESYV